MNINKKKNKIMYIIFILIMTFVILSNITQVLGTSQINPTTPTQKEITNPMQVIIGIFQVVAVGVAIIMLIVLAIKYMSSAPSDRAEIKKHAVVYIVGAVICFGASGILGIIKEFVNETLK